MTPLAIALNKKLSKTRVGRLWAQRPGVANAFAAARDPASDFFANRLGLSGPYSIALIEIDHGIRRVEKQVEEVRFSKRLPLAGRDEFYGGGSVADADLRHPE
jgi:hypothetical protein